MGKYGGCWGSTGGEVGGGFRGVAVGKYEVCLNGVHEVPWGLRGVRWKYGEGGVCIEGGDKDEG